MTLEIISRKVTHQGAEHILYEFYGQGCDAVSFSDWLSMDKLRRRWYSWRSFSWEFINPIDDVTIRLQWAEFFIEPSLSDYYNIQNRFENVVYLEDKRKRS